MKFAVSFNLVLYYLQLYEQKPNPNGFGFVVGHLTMLYFAIGSKPVAPTSGVEVDSAVDFSAVF